MEQFMTKREGGNKTVVTEFIFIGFKTLPELQTLFLIIFLAFYIVTMVGNILIVAVVLTNDHLHKPMYFFLGNLSVLEICYTSTILPRILASFMSGYHGISFHGCFLQFYFFSTFGCTECYLLAVMSYDRFVAICKPLHYVSVMKIKLCVQLSFTPWIIGAVLTAFTTFSASQLTFCGPNEIDHFFCDYTPLLMLSCSETHQAEMLMSVLGSACILPPMILTFASYVCIISTILKIPSNSGKKKAFSTCSSHLIVVIIFFGTSSMVYLLPNTDTLKDLNKIFSVFYTILTPMFNPFIYGLRNRESKEALTKAFSKFVPVRTIQGNQRQ